MFSELIISGYLLIWYLFWNTHYNNININKKKRTLLVNAAAVLNIKLWVFITKYIYNLHNVVWILLNIVTSNNNNDHDFMIDPQTGSSTGNYKYIYISNLLAKWF